jgi:regulator of protease activity HflC (stomatin/prohibitin superfamily)
MTTDETLPSSEAELRAELRALLRRAYDSDLEIEGGWDCRNGTDYPDWDVIVTEVRKNEVPKQEIPATDE